MKKSLLIFAIIWGAFAANANQVLGGEISWTCQGNGFYVFEVDVYYDCSKTTSMPTSQLINWSYSLVPISCSLQDSISISPDCRSINSKISCDTTIFFSPVKKYTYRSNALKLSANIPATGWTFSTIVANRFPTNNTLGTSNNFVLRSKMYPYTKNGSAVSALNCYDNSPKFAEKPRYAFSTESNLFFIGGIDFDKKDSLFYDFAPSFTGTVANPDTINYASSFAFNKPLPDTLADINNIKMSVSPEGQVFFRSLTTGRFTNCYKIESWRDGQKIAEVFQDFEMQINLDIPGSGLCASTFNLIPNVSLGWYPNYSVLDVYPSAALTYSTEVFAGDSIKFKISASDYDLSPDCVPQIITATASGSAMNFGGQNCVNPPCAEFNSLNINGTFSSSINNDTEFFWKTDTAHVDKTEGRSVYWFYFSFEDSHCTLTGRNELAVKVIVKMPISAQQSQLSLCSGDTATTTIFGDTTNLSWSPTTNISCTTCATPKFYPSTTTKYAVTDLNTGFVSYVNVDASKISAPPMIVPGGAGILLTNGSDFDTVIYTRNGAPFYPNPNTSYAPFLSGDYAVIGKVGVCSENSDTVYFDIKNNLAGNSVDDGNYVETAQRDQTYGTTFRLVKESFYNINGVYVQAFASNNSPKALDNLVCKIHDGGPTNVVFTSDSVVRISDDIIKFYGQVNLAANHDYLLSIYADTNVLVPIYEPIKWPVVAADERVYVFNATEKFGDSYPNVSAISYPYFHFSLGYGIGQDEFSETTIHVYPNPAKAIFVIQGVLSGEYKLINTVGQLVAQGAIAETTEVQTAHLQQGMYVLEIKNGAGKSIQKKILIIH